MRRRVGSLSFELRSVASSISGVLGLGTAKLLRQIVDATEAYSRWVYKVRDAALLLANAPPKSGARRWVVHEDYATTGRSLDLATLHQAGQITVQTGGLTDQFTAGGRDGVYCAHAKVTTQAD